MTWSRIPDSTRVSRLPQPGRREKIASAPRQKIMRRSDCKLVTNCMLCSVTRNGDFLKKATGSFLQPIVGRLVDSFSLAFRGGFVAVTIRNSGETEKNCDDKGQPGIHHESGGADGAGFIAGSRKYFCNCCHQPVAERNRQKPETHDETFHFRRGFT